MNRKWAKRLIISAVVAAVLSLLLVFGLAASTQIDHFTAEDPAATVTVPIGTSLTDATSELPSELAAVDKDGNEIKVPVKWADGGLYDGEKAGVYIFSAQMSKGYYYEKHVPLATVFVGKLHESSIHATASDGAEVTVTGRIPEGAEVSITPMEMTEDELTSYLGESKAGAVKEYTAYDIKIMVDGTEWQPDESVKVRISRPSFYQFDHSDGNLEENAKATIKRSDLELENGEVPNVAHVDVSEHVVDTDTVTTVKNDELAFEADSFSPFIIYTYTVDFHYDEKVFSIPGNSSVLLSEIFSVLEIDKNAADATSVTFSDASLIEIEQVTNDWKLTSLQAFSTDEMLTINFADGSTLEIVTTDLQPGVIGNAVNKVIKSGDNNTCTNGMPFSTFTFLPARINIGNTSNYTLTNAANGIQYLSSTFNPGASGREPALIYEPNIKGGNQVTLSGTFAVLTFRDAARDEVGNNYDVEFTLSDLKIVNRGTQEFSRVGLIFNSMNPSCAPEVLGGNVGSHDAGVSMRISIRVIGAPSSGSIPFMAKDIDQPDKHYGTGSSAYGQEYCETVTINSGALTKAYIPNNSKLYITATNTGGKANHITFVGTTTDSDTMQEGFATQIGTSGVDLSWKGVGCETFLFNRANEFSIRPHFRRYQSDGTFTQWTVENTGGTITMSDSYDSSILKWDNLPHDNRDYLRRYYVNQKTSNIVTAPKTGYKLVSLTKNTSANDNPSTGEVFNNTNGGTYSATATNAHCFLDAFYEPITTSIKIHKQDQAGMAMSGVTFTVTGTSSVHGDFTLSGTTDANGDVTISNIPYGSSSDTYTITETVPSGYTAGTKTKTFTFKETQQSFTFTNFKNATIHIKKVVSNYSSIPSDAAKTFTMNWTGTDNADATTMTVGTDGTATRNNVKTVTFSSTEAKNINVTEELTPLVNGIGYVLNSMTYSTTGFDTGTEIENGENIPVSPGQNIYITVTNKYTPAPAKIHIKKIVSNSAEISDDAERTFTMKWVGTDNLTDTEMSIGTNGMVTVNDAKTVSFTNGSQANIRVTEVTPQSAGSHCGEYTFVSMKYSKNGFDDNSAISIDNGTEISVSPNDNVYITVTNRYWPPVAKIHIKKIISNYDEVPSDVTKVFTMNWTGTTDTGSTDMLVEDESGVTINDVKTVMFNDVAEKSITVTEALPVLINGSYELESIRYSTTGFDTGTNVNNGDNISISAGQNVYITVTNVYKPGTAKIRVKKIVSNYDDYEDKLSGQEFFINLSGGVETGLTLKHNATSKKIEHVINGNNVTVKISEVVPMEYVENYLISTEITHANGKKDTVSGNTITILPGDDVLITVTNTYEPKPFFKKTASVENRFEHQ